MELKQRTQSSQGRRGVSARGEKAAPRRGKLERRRRGRGVGRIRCDATRTLALARTSARCTARPRRQCGEAFEN
eukprot:13414-Pleurochrysis_carterae.AAC.1